MFVIYFPFTMDNFECNILVRWPGLETKNRKVWVIWAFSECERRSLCYIKQVGVEDLNQ